MKKAGSFILIGLVFFLFMISFASAASNINYQMNRAVEQVTDFISPILTPLLGNSGDVGNFSDSEVVFAKLLFALLVMLVVKTGLDRIGTFSTKPGIKWGISIIIALVGVRFLASDTIIAMTLPSSALAVAITSGLPLIIYFFIVEPIKSLTVRRVLWLLFGVAFLGLFIARGVDLAGFAFWIYPVTALLALIMMIFDGTIQSFFTRLSLEKMGLRNIDEQERFLRRSMNLARQDFTQGIINKGQLDSLIARYKEDIEALRASI